jgi:signal transduction histidine kinase
MRLSGIATAAGYLFKAGETNQILASTAGAIVPAIADWCRIDLYDGDGTVTESLVVHHDPAQQQIIRQLEVPRNGNTIMIGERNRIPINGMWLTSASDGDGQCPEGDTEHKLVATGFEVDSLISVPLRDGEDLHGCMYVGTDDKRVELGRGDMQCLQQIAEMTASRLGTLHHITRLTDSNASDDRFIALLGNEIHMPLTAVQAALDIAADTALPHSARAALEIAQRNLSLELQLLHDLQEVSRMKDDRLRLDISLLDVHSILNDLSKNFHLDSSGSELHCTLDLSAAECHVAGDAKRLQQIFRNLLKYAVMHSSQSRQIFVRTHHQMQQLVVELEVIGLELNAKELESIRGLFTNHKDCWPVLSNGLGLGLSMSASLVELHHGSITIQRNAPGTGVMFTVALPFVKQSDSKDEKFSKTSAVSSTQHHDQQTILLVDDHVDMVTVYRQLLQQRGYKVQVAYTMAEALKLGEHESFDILISDIGLPDGDGIELMHRLAEHGPIRAIAVSGYGTYNDIQRSLTAGYALHLVKPFSVKLLCEAIEKILESDGFQ